MPVESRFVVDPPPTPEPGSVLVDLGTFTGSQSVSALNRGGGAAAARIAEEVAKGSSEAPLIVRWIERDGRVACVTEIHYDRLAARLRGMRGCPGSSTRQWILLYEFENVTAARIQALAKQAEPLHRLAFYGCTQVDGTLNQQ